MESEPEGEGRLGPENRSIRELRTMKPELCDSCSSKEPLSFSTSNYKSPFGDPTLTKVFVGGFAWETPTDLMRTYFEQFGEILEAVIINDKNTGKSKGFDQ